MLIKHRTLIFVLLIPALFVVSCRNSNSTKLESSKLYDHEDEIMLTATSNQEIVDGGIRILEEGGSAMDAVLSTSLAEIARHGGKYVSYAGFMNVIYFEAETGKIHNMNAAFNTVLEESDPLSIPNANYNILNFDAPKKLLDCLLYTSPSPRDRG